MIRLLLQDKLGHLKNWEEKYLLPANYNEAKRRHKDTGVSGVTTKPNRPLVYDMNTHTTNPPDRRDGDPLYDSAGKNEINYFMYLMGDA